MPSHQLDYEILGSSAQSVEIILDPGETVIAEAGAMNYMTDGVRFETRMGDGSSSGLLGKLWSAGKRMLTGESLFMTHFSNGGKTQARVAFAAPYPGTVVPIDLTQIGGRLICQKDAFSFSMDYTLFSFFIQNTISTSIKKRLSLKYSISCPASAPKIVPCHATVRIQRFHHTQPAAGR